MDGVRHGAEQDFARDLSDVVQRAGWRTRERTLRPPGMQVYVDEITAYQVVQSNSREKISVSRTLIHP